MHLGTEQHRAETGDTKLSSILLYTLPEEVDSGLQCHFQPEDVECTPTAKRTLISCLCHDEWWRFVGELSGQNSQPLGETYTFLCYRTPKRA
ncbi:unnamed protein product [Leuciscus chuanchicus]